MQKSCIPYIPYQSLLLSTIVLNDIKIFFSDHIWWTENTYIYPMTGHYHEHITVECF